ncbi:TetR/AcrR family transcriptional regulator [Priestia megaterium]|uniref:TetR/AcrR family transcriptional regulator n=1 Tax=Priestia megaterium TaxID=1404 RepID=UPI00159C31D1|nr:TetR/AcrR family transcriptional regulator [Priestia megaterium]
MTHKNNSFTDPRIIRTRLLIKDAFVELLQEMDIDKMSVSRIANRATISRVTFYLHYRDIPDMLEKLADEMIEDIQEATNIQAIAVDSVKDADYLKLVRLLEHIAEHADFYKVTLGSRKAPIFTERLLNMLTTTITQRFEDVRDDPSNDKREVKKEIAIWYGSSALIGTIVAWLKNDMPYTPHFLAKQFYLLNAHRQN